jgi:LCP family protein required for cell wall assembly
MNKTLETTTKPEDILPTGVDTEYDMPSIIPLDDPTPTEEVTGAVVRPATKYRSEDYVKTYLLFGIEEIGGAANTDAILLLSVNTMDNTLKLTSIMRDTFVDIPGYYSNKINSVYAHGMKTGETLGEKRLNGGKLLTEVIEETFNIDITGFACVNFRNFQDIIDRLGGIDLELGSSEASYLRTTNYISNPAYRTVQAGWNHMNGNQVLGYCRVRKRATLGGANADYGRTLRHRRVINAVVQQYKSLPLTDMYSALKDILGYIITDLTEEDISTMLRNIVENKTFSLEQFRLPVDGMFKDSGKKGIFNGKYTVTYALTLDKYRDDNIKALHDFVFLDDKIAAENGEAATEGTDEAATTGETTPTPVSAPAA